MNYRNIQIAYQDLYAYIHAKMPFTLSLQGTEINSELEEFFKTNKIYSKKSIENDAQNEAVYLGVLYEYLQDLLEDLEDLDDPDFEKHKEEYRTVNQILNLIIATLAHDPE